MMQIASKVEGINVSGGKTVAFELYPHSYAMINQKYTNLDADYIATLEFNKRYIWDQTSNTYQTLQVKQVVHDDKFQILSVYNDITA